MTATRVSPFQLLQWKYAIRLEMKGIKVARRSVNAHAGRFFGLGSRCKRETVIEHIEAALRQCKRDDVPVQEAVTVKRHTDSDPEHPVPAEVTQEAERRDRDRYQIALLNAARKIEKLMLSFETEFDEYFDQAKLDEAREELTVALKPFSDGGAW